MQKTFADIACTEVDSSSIVIFPFRCDLGFNICIGKNVIVNNDCTFLDTILSEFTPYSDSYENEHGSDNNYSPPIRFDIWRRAFCPTLVTGIHGMAAADTAKDARTVTCSTWIR